jgi:hypothetical protein
MRPECHSPWLMLDVCTYPMYMTLLCCEISLMHRPLNIMCLVCTRAFTKIDHDATRNVINMLYATPWFRRVIISRPCDFSSHPSCHPCVSHQYNYPSTCSSPIPRSNCTEPSYPFVIAMQIKSYCSTTSLFIIFSIILALVVKTLKERPELFRKYSHVQLTPIHSKFDPISIQNLPLSSIK